MASSPSRRKSAARLSTSRRKSAARLSTFVHRLDALSTSTRVALHDDSRETTFADLIHRARRARTGLCKALACSPASLVGRRIALLASPSASWVEAFLAIVLAGGIALPLAPIYPAAELAWFLADSDADLVIASESEFARASSLGARARVARLEDLFLDEPPLEPVSIDADAVALLLYTSGTTGKPKGAMITHANLAVQAELLREAWGFSEDDGLLHALPLHHLHGLGISLLTSFLAGARTRMLPRFDAPRVWDELGADGCTVWMAVPTMYQKLFEAFDAADAPTRDRWTNAARRLRLATSGSAALPVTLAERWRSLTGAIPLERFGMTEIGVGMSNALDIESRRAGSVGRPLRTVELRLIDESGRECNGAGELVIRGPSIFVGYWRRPEATAAAFNGGWFKTGDRVECAQDGYVRVLGRTSVDILKSGGYKLSALEIEEALRDYGAIAEVAVVGVPDETWGERVVAVVVSAPGQEAACASEVVRAWAKERLAPYKVPREVIVVSALPRNAVGKVIKPEIVLQIARTKLRK